MAVTVSGGIITDAPSSQTLKNGAFILTWSDIGAVVCEEFDLELGMRELDTMDENGKPNKAAYIPTKGKGTCTCQIKSSTTAVPARGATATYPPIGGGSVRTIIAISEAQSFRNNDITKFKINIVEVLNP